MLKLLLDCFANEYKEALIMCEKDSIPSNKVIQANGGVFINQIEKFGRIINRYKIILRN